MELKELKQKWDALDKGLTRSEMYNKKVLMELVGGKTATSYDKLRRLGIFNLIVTFGIATVLIPLLHSRGVFGHEATFWILEAVCVLGLLMVICRLGILSRFNVMSDPEAQIRNLVRYKRYYVYEMVIGVPLAVFAITSTFFIEKTASPLGWAFLALGVLAGASCGWMGWQRHKGTMQEIEQSLAELKELKAP